MAKIKFRRDTAANWAQANPVLAQGEPGFEHDTGLLKIGDGASTWLELDYSSGSAASLTDDGSVEITAGNTEHWIATQRRDQHNIYPRGLRYDSQGNLYSLTSTGDNVAPMTVLTKYTAAGAVAWQKTIGESQAMTLAVDSSDRAYITVSFNNPAIGVVKFSTAGAILWQKSYDIGPIPAFNALIEEKSSTTLALVASVADGQIEAPTTILAMEISATDGSVLVKKSIELDPDDQVVYATGIDVDPDENVFISGYYVDANDNGRDKMFIEKLDQTLERVWTKSLEAPDGYNMDGGDCASDALGNIYAVGTYSVNTINTQGTTDQSAAILVKLNSSGVVQWTRRVGPGPCGSFHAGMTATATGDVYLSALTLAKKTDGVFADAPETLQEILGSNKLVVARYNTQGAVIWQRYVDVANLNEDFDEGARNQAMAVFGDKFVVDGYGFSTNYQSYDDASTADDETDYFVVQLPTDGTELTIGGLGFTESRVPGRFVTHTTSTSPLTIVTYAETVLAEDSTLTVDDETRVANNIVKSEAYSYTFGADGTFTIPNDGDIKLTQTQVGWLMAVGTTLNNNDDITGRATTVDSQGNMYLGGNDSSTGDSFVMKISPDGTRLWGVRWEESNNSWGGRVSNLSINPTTGNLMALAEVYGNYTYSVLATIDQDTGRILSNETFDDADSDVVLADLAWTITGDYVLAGRKSGNFSPEISVTPETGSTTSTLIVLRSAVDGIPNSWQVGGTGFSVFETVAYVERYTGLTGTVRQGSGATFDVIADGAGNYTVSLPKTTLATVSDTYLSGATVPTGSTTINSDNIVTTGGWDYVNIFDAGLQATLEATPITHNTIVPVTWSSGSTTLSGYVFVQYPGNGSFQIAPVDINGNPVAGTWYFPVSFNQVSPTGTNYLVGHKIKVLGSTLGGTDVTNDAIIEVTSADAGAITAATITGTSTGSSTYPAVSGTNVDVGSGFELTFEGPRNSTNYLDYSNYNITVGGSNYVENDIIVIAGTSLGGTTPANDLTLRIGVSVGSVVSIYDATGTSQSSTWKLETTTAVDFGGAGSWSITYPLSNENLLVTDTWQRTFGTQADDSDQLYAVAVDSEGSIIAVGQGNGKVDVGQTSIWDLAVVYKFDNTGTLEWTRQLNEIDDNCSAKSVVTIGTDIYVTHDSNDNSDTVITKLDTAGTIVWQKVTSGKDDSCIARTADGNLLVIAEDYYEEVDDDSIKIYKMTPSGEVVYKRWLSATSNADTWLATPRGLSVDANNFYIGAYFETDNYQSGLAVRLPLDGSGTGEYGSFSYVDVNAQTSNFTGTGLMDNNYAVNSVDLSVSYAGALVDGTDPYINTGTTITAGTGAFTINAYYPDLTTEIIRDTDGGSIVFADGSRQSTSATDIPQRRYVGQRYMLGFEDRGHHVLIDQNITDSIVVPYDSRVPFPVGTVITIVNMNSGSISINTEGGNTSIMLAGDGYGSGYSLAGYGMATLLKVGTEQWVASGNLTSF